MRPEYIRFHERLGMIVMKAICVAHVEDKPYAGVRVSSGVRVLCIPCLAAPAKNPNMPSYMPGGRVYKLCEAVNRGIPSHRL